MDVGWLVVGGLFESRGDENLNLGTAVLRTFESATIRSLSSIMPERFQV